MENLSKRILVVDDDQGILDSFEVLLGDRYDLVKAENGYEALRILETNPPQLMFLDIKMPGLDGIDVLKRLQEYQKGRCRDHHSQRSGKDRKGGEVFRRHRLFEEASGYL